jgi:hypothetical protein
MASRPTTQQTTTPTAHSEEDDGYVAVYCPECDVNTERSIDELKDVCFNCNIETKYVPIAPSIEDTGNDGFYFEEVFGTPDHLGIAFALSDLNRTPRTP